MGYAALLVLTFLWGTTFPFIKVIVEAIGYSYYVFLRFTIASLAVIPLVLARRGSARLLRECFFPGLVLSVLFFLGMADHSRGRLYEEA